MYSYVYNVGISMNFTEIPGKLSCKLDKPPVDNQKRIFAYYIKIFRDNKEVENTTVSLTYFSKLCFKICESPVSDPVEFNRGQKYVRRL